ncbi:MAG: two pore domain potassium channel family protein [Planctomycetes bacterium]|nr:two pore domain potassium channel family protein [Planctomycetota bacterium]
MSDPIVEIHPRGTRCSFLLSALLALFVLYPLLGSHPAGSALLDVFVSGALLLTVRALRGPNRGVFFAALVLSVLAIVATAAGHLLGSVALLPVAHVLGLLFFLLTGLTLLKRVLEPGPGTVERLQAAVCAYLLIGLGWGLVFSLMEHSQPGAFRDPLGGSHESHAVLAGFPHLIYYSFTTLTTLGFGDVVPTTAMARSLSTLEAVIGQLYLAVLVARLVGLHSDRLVADEPKECPAEGATS